MKVRNGYKEFREKKKDILYARMDNSMIKALREIREKTGISTSELLREGARRIIAENRRGGIRIGG